MKTFPSHLAGQPGDPPIFTIPDALRRAAKEWPEQEAMAGYRHPDLAHVAHHEAVYCIERICNHADHKIDYRNIPGCTYTHPQVASMGMSESTR